MFTLDRIQHSSLATIAIFVARHSVVQLLQWSICWQSLHSPLWCKESVHLLMLCQLRKEIAERVVKYVKNNALISLLQLMNCWLHVHPHVMYYAVNFHKDVISQKEEKLHLKFLVHHVMVTVFQIDMVAFLNVPLCSLVWKCCIKVEGKCLCI